MHHFSVASFLGLLLVLGISSANATTANDLITADTASATHKIVGYDFALLGKICRGKIANVDEVLAKRSRSAIEFERRIALVVQKYRARTRKELGTEAESNLYADAHAKNEAFAEQVRSSSSNDPPSRTLDCSTSPHTLADADRELEGILAWLESQ